MQTITISSRYGKNDDNRSLNLKTRLSAQTEAQGQMIAAIVSNTITVAKGPAGCVDKESLILTDKGLMTLEEIILLQRKDLNFLGFEDFTYNLMVLSHDKTWNPITDIYATEEDTEGYIITTKYGNKLKCSWKHPLYTINPKGVYEWVKAIDLKVGQQIGTYVNNDTYEFEKICEDKFFWDEIISIEPIKQKFYDISVKDKSSFICNNMISHNTGKTCVATLKAAQMLNDKEVDKVILTRPVVEIGKSMGFLPGSIIVTGKQIGRAHV